MKRLFIMRGLPGSGKSTACVDGLKLSTDDYFMVGGTYCFDPSQLGPAHRWNQWRVSKACERALPNVYVDNTNTTWKEFKPYLEAAANNDYEVLFATPVTNWAFNVDTCYLKNTHRVPKEVIQKMHDRFMSNEEIIKLMNSEFPNVACGFHGPERGEL